jgi:hypothetical protein
MDRQWLALSTSGKRGLGRRTGIMFKVGNAVCMSISTPAREAFNHFSAWLVKAPWESRFKAFLKESLSEIAAVSGMSRTTLMDRAEMQGWASLLMRAVTEHFAELTFPEPPLNAYLERRGWKETREGREYLQGVRSVPFSIYRVQDVTPGVSAVVQDVIRPLPPVSIQEALGSRGMQVGDWLLAKVVEVAGKPYFTGTLLKIEPEKALSWIAHIYDTLQTANLSVDPDTLNQPEQRQAIDALIGAFGLDLIADGIAYVLTPWPTLVHRDGHALLLTELRFPLKDKDAVIDVLERWPDFEREPDEETPSWLWLQPQDVDLSGPRTVLGAITLSEKWVKYRTNSKERSDALQARLQVALPEALGRPLVAHQSPESALLHAKPLPASTIPELDTALYPLLDAHYRKLLDTPIPMLNHESPRQAVQSDSGRHHVLQWLNHLEDSNRMQKNMADYDFGWLWQELGMIREENR